MVVVRVVVRVVWREKGRQRDRQSKRFEGRQDKWRSMMVSKERRRRTVRQATAS